MKAHLVSSIILRASIINYLVRRPVTSVTTLLWFRLFTYTHTYALKCSVHFIILLIDFNFGI